MGVVAGLGETPFGPLVPGRSAPGRGAMRVEAGLLLIRPRRHGHTLIANGRFMRSRFEVMVQPSVSSVT